MTTHSGPAERIDMDDARIESALSHPQKADAVRVREVLAKARELRGLDADDVASLMSMSDPELIDELFSAARKAKETIYGRRLVFFAPLYVSNLCSNDCLYCAFRSPNQGLVRRALTQAEVAEEVTALIEQGHKRVLLVAGESYPEQGFQYVLDCIETIYATKLGHGEIRRANVNVAPLGLEEFRRLKDAGIGTYQLFQETYHRPTYAKVHVSGPKRNYDWRITALDRAMECGIDDVGVGILFGLFDWRYEVLALMQHIEHLEARYGVGPHTISVPRLEPATGADLASHPPQPVSDLAFRKIIAILRLAVPYTGIIMSTRESADIRRETFALGVSQISAGSRTNPGGYQDGPREEEAGQFSLGDHRSLDDVIRDVAELGYVPSFCTGCYRLGRTGADFMDLARPGAIKAHCEPNALSTFREYLRDFASAETLRAGEAAIARSLSDMEPAVRKRAEAMLERVGAGEDDVYC